MREHVKQFVKICADTLPIAEPIYEFGSLQQPEQHGLADLRPLFPGKRYIGADMQPGPGVDIVLDLHRIELPSESAGTVLVLDTLEHVEFIRQAIAEAYRILTPQGILIISSVMNFRVHNYPHDYWRFTPQGFKSLLEVFPVSFVESAGEACFPHTIVGVGFKEPRMLSMLTDLEVRCKHWKKEWSNPVRGGAAALFKFVLPPAFVFMVRKFRGDYRQ
jgi:SAM-dependent methyltransferase